MDPFYFMDLDIELKNGEDAEGPWEYCDCSPGGDWIIRCDDGYVIYKNKKYKKICYDNKCKIITFTAVNNTTTKQKLTLDTIDPRLERDDAYWRERGGLIEEVTQQNRRVVRDENGDILAMY